MERNYYIDYYNRCLKSEENSCAEIDGCVYAVINNEIVALEVNVPSTVISYSLPDFVDVIGTKFWNSLKYTNIYDLHTSNVYRLERIGMDASIGKVQSLFLDNVVEIDEEQFMFCMTLAAVIAPKLKVIPKYSLDYCKNLYYLDCESVIECNSNLGDISKFKKLHLPNCKNNFFDMKQQEDFLGLEKQVESLKKEESTNLFRHKSKNSLRNICISLFEKNKNSDLCLFFSALGKILFND